MKKSNLEDKARTLALISHGNQMYGAYPYSKHLKDVVAVLNRFDIHDDWVLACAWLHDSLEDTTLSQATIETELGRAVAELVFAVTTETGHDRHERNFKTYPKIKAHPMGVYLKLSDRIANVEASIANNTNKLKMYKKEFLEFKAVLKTQGVADKMWAHLESLLT